MGRIIKALILGWIGKKIYDRVAGSDEPEDDAEPTKAHAAERATPAKKNAPKRTSRKTTRRAA